MKAGNMFAIGITTMVLFFSACKKEETKEDTTPPDLTPNLIGKDWIMTGWTLQPQGGSTLDKFASLPPCIKDDLIEFISTGTITLKEGASKCTPSDPDTSPGGNWALINNSKLRWIDGDTTDYDVLELSSTDLKLKITYEDSGVSYTETEVYKKKQ